MRRRLWLSNLLRFCVLVAITIAGLAFLSFCAKEPTESSAISATEFKAGRIIDDSIFYNANTMSAKEIDAFIKSHSPACDMWGKKQVGNGVYVNGKLIPATTTRAQEAKMRREKEKRSIYHDPPYVCVSEYYENPTTHKTNFETGGKKEAGMLSAGEIIYKAAQTYKVNPQVLLVMLKKESYAWGDEWPLKWEYNTVMGYACPDTAPCNEEYYGFYNQMMTAAWQLNYYREHINSYSYKPYRNNSILYSPTTSCGRKNVYLENVATTSLYIYTPYTPNDAALRNYPGTASCGSYGNRNFYMYFREWFGSTLESKQMAAISKIYNTGANSTLLGEPVSELRNNNVAYWVKYENGYIVGSDKTGYFVSMLGKIRDVWAANGYEVGRLGLPTNPQKENVTYDSKWQCFQNGCIIGSDKTGYFVSMYDRIRDAWAKNGYEAGVLGFPIAEQNQNTAIGSRWQKFENGYIVGSDKTGYFVSMLGKIRDVWAANGYEAGKLGLPVADQKENTIYGSKWQKFENGYIVGSDKTGYFVSMLGALRDTWGASGFEAGKLGLPIANPVESKNKSSQKFQGGTISCANNKCSITYNK